MPYGEPAVSRVQYDFSVQDTTLPNLMGVVTFEWLGSTAPPPAVSDEFMQRVMDTLKANTTLTTNNGGRIVSETASFSPTPPA